MEIRLYRFCMFLYLDIKAFMSYDIQKIKLINVKTGIPSFGHCPLDTCTFP